MQFNRLSIALAALCLTATTTSALAADPVQLTLVASCVRPDGTPFRLPAFLAGTVGVPWIMNDVEIKEFAVQGPDGKFEKKVESLAGLVLKADLKQERDGSFLISGQGTCSGHNLDANGMPRPNTLGFTNQPISGRATIGGEPVVVHQQDGWRLMIQLQPLMVIRPQG